MNTLKQLQEKGEEEFKKKFIGLTGLGASKKVWWVDDPIRVLNWHHQQTTLAYNAGKADMIDTVLKEIEIVKENVILNGSSTNYKDGGIGDESEFFAYRASLDTLKNKLLDK